MGMSPMIAKKTLNYFEMKAVFREAQLVKSPIVGSFMVDGKWRLIELHVCGCSDDFVDFHSQNSCEQLQPEHPIGVCIHLGYFKYLFDSTVLTTISHEASWRVLLNPPDVAERIERRAYHRQPVPVNTTVKVTFWHRGYLEEFEHLPTEHYWQGTLLNLSAGGARFEIELEHKKHFCIGQVLGIQFTPMSYQKPLMLESHVKYTEEQSDRRHFRIGVEFLGLEASREGRHILDRILEVTREYEAMNAQVGTCQNS